MLMPTDELQIAVDELRETHRQREDFHRAEKRLTLQIKSICRRLCEGSKTEAGVLYTAITTAKKDHPRAAAALVYLMPMFDARSPLEAERKRAERAMKKLARKLPVWPWIEATHGIGDLGIAQIVAECGDLNNYANPAKLWKRMGLGLVNGERQRRMTDAELALLHGYNPSRRAIMHCIGDSVVRAGKGPYREVYDEYKARHAEQHPELTPGHINRRAMRYMEKRILRDLWRVWRERGQRGSDAHEKCAPLASS